MEGVNRAFLAQSGRPVVPAAFCFALGIGISHLFLQYSFTGIASGAALLLLASFLSYRKQKSAVSCSLVLAVILLAGMLTGFADRDGYDRGHLRSLLDLQVFPLEEPVLFEGCIESGSPLFRDDIEIIVSLKRFRINERWIECKGNGILRITPRDSRDRSRLEDLLMCGSIIRTWAIWKKPRNFENPGSIDRKGQLARSDIYIIGRTKSSRLIESISFSPRNIPSRMAHHVRSRIRNTLKFLRDNGKGRQGAILASLLIGDRSALDRSTGTVFQNAGSYHILVVSGLHVAWIAGASLIALKWIGIPERLRYLSSAFIILVYAWTVGFQAGITRCLWMFLLYMIGRILLRRSDTINILFSTALLLLSADPDRLLDAGYQLSFLSVAAITLTALPAIAAWIEPVLQPMRNAGYADRLFFEPGRIQRYGRNLRCRCELFAESIADSLPLIRPGMLLLPFRCTAMAGFATGSMILLSLSVQAWTAPLAAFYFNRISWVAPLSNPAIVPIASITLAAGFLAVSVSCIPLFGQWLVCLAGALASLLADLAELVTRIPIAWQRCPTLSPLPVLTGLLILLLWTSLRWKRTWIPFLYNLMLIAYAAIGASPFSTAILRSMRNTVPAAGTDALHMGPKSISITLLDVGEGDSVIIRYPNGRLWVLDAGGLLRSSFDGNTDDAFDIGEAVVSRYLWDKWGRNPDRVILSHTDIDHAGGIPAVLNNFRVARLEYPFCRADRTLRNIMETAMNRETAVHSTGAGTVEKIGEVLVNVLHPPGHPLKNSANDTSLVHAVAYKRFTALLTGDLEKKGEAELLSYQGELRSILLKVSHHGSRGGTSSAFLDAVSPRWGIISAGRGNRFGHPAPQVLKRLSQRGTRIYQTTKEGAITFKTDGSLYEISSHLHGILETGTLE